MSTKNSKIEELYSSFNKADVDKISILLGSNFFGQSDIMLKIHEFTSELSDKEDLDKMALHRYIYGSKESFSDGKLRVYMTKLTQILEKYITIKHLDNAPQTSLQLLTAYYSQHKLAKNTSIFYKSAPEIQFESYEDALNYQYHFAAKKLDYINQEFPNDGDKLKEQYDILSQAQKVLNIYQTLKTQCDIFSLQQKYKFDRDNSFEMSILKYLQLQSEFIDPILEAYFLVYTLYQDFNEDTFLRLKSIILDSESISFATNLRGLNQHYQNFCIRIINLGNNDYLSHLLDSYIFGLRFIKNEGDLSSVSFRNIVFCALNLGKLDWAETFVENYNDKVNEEKKGNSYHFNLARIAFEKKNYKEAMRLLLRVSYEDSFYASTARILLIKCYYELNDESPLNSCCTSLTQYLKRNKDFTKQRIENNLHFVSFVKNLQTNRLKNNKNLFQKINEKVQESKVVEKEWLLSKVSELTKGSR